MSVAGNREELGTGVVRVTGIVQQCNHCTQLLSGGEDNLLDLIQFCVMLNPVCTT